MAELTIKPKEQETLKVTIGDKEFSIPLRGSLSVKEALVLETEQGAFSFFKKRIPKDIFEALTVDELNQVIAVWKKESDKHSEMKLGESQASRDL